MEPFTAHTIATLLASLRLVPIFAFAPPFTMMRIPGVVRLILALALASWLIRGSASEFLQTTQPDLGLLLVAGLGELSLGASNAICLQLTHAAILFVGRTLDVQAGFGLALLIDPVSKAQTPLVGTILTYGSALVFFASDGLGHLIAIWSLSYETVPVGLGTFNPRLGLIAHHFALAMSLALGLIAVPFLALFMVDLTIALMSRTLPQMNVLLIGFQIKALVLITSLPIAIGLSAGKFLHMTRLTLEASARLSLGN